MAVSSILGTKNRTSVLYDFSIVKKARFYVFELTTVGNMTDFQFQNEILYVQINPAEMSAIMSSKRKVAPTALENGAPSYRPQDWSSSDDDFRISLRYDLYDEFMVGTADGLLTGAVQDRDLSSMDATSLGKLIDYSKDYNKFLFFKWGTMQYFGYIRDLNVTYTAFSRFGNPLKANAELTLARAGQSVSGTGDTIYAEENYASVLGTVIATIKATDTLEDVALRAEIGATQALR